MRNVMSQAQIKGVELGLSWLCLAQDANTDGGVPAYYRPLTRFSKSYPETTGYLIPTLEMFKATDVGTNWDQRIYKMISWLLSIQNENGSFPGGVWPSKQSLPSVFNSGQILYGLVSQYKTAPSDRLYDALVRCADWLVSVQNVDGSWTKYAYNNQFYVYNARVAWALELAGRAIGREVYRNAATASIANCVTNQKSNGWFDKCSFDPKLPPVLHTFAYTTQGVLEVGLSQSNDDFITSARKASDPLLTLIEKDGMLPGRVTSDFVYTPYLCPTGMAQQGIVFQRLFYAFGDSQYEAAASKLELSLFEIQSNRDSILSPKGGLAGSVPLWGDYMKFRYPKWAIKFFLDFIFARTTSGKEVVEG
jgi:hypothetical protein